MYLLIIISFARDLLTWTWRLSADQSSFCKSFLTLKADLHGTILSHTTSLRQAYDLTQDLHDNHKRAVGLIHKKQVMSQAFRKLVVGDKVVPCKWSCKWACKCTVPARSICFRAGCAFSCVHAGAIPERSDPRLLFILRISKTVFCTLLIQQWTAPNQSRVNRHCMQ